MCQDNILTLLKKLGVPKTFSIELCPNKTLNFDELRILAPAFCSVIWANQSDEALQEISELPAIVLTKKLIMHGYQLVFHIAGRYLSKVQARNVLDELQKLNVKNLLVLKGETTPKLKDKLDFPHASDFIKFIRSNYGDFFCIGVAAYVDANNMKYLKLKVNSGADFIITQMIFELEPFLNFSKRCRECDINVPILPGIYIIDSYNDLMQMTKYCRVKIPKSIVDSIDCNKDNPEDVHKFGIHHCGELIKTLFNNSEMCTNCVHFFSLNNVKLVQQVCNTLQL